MFSGLISRTFIRQEQSEGTLPNNAELNATNYESELITITVSTRLPNLLCNRWTSDRWIQPIYRLLHFHT